MVITLARVQIFVSILAIFSAMFGVRYIFLPKVNSDQFRKFMNRLKVGAHRGLALDYPENTLSAFKMSKKLGADFFECDLQFTKDGVPVILHDDTVDRTTNGAGRIRDLLFREVRQLNAAAKFRNHTREKFEFENIPTLDEFVQVCLDLNVKVMFDLKHFHPNVVTTMASLFNKNPVLYETAAVCSMYPQIIYFVKKADPKIITGHIWWPHDTLTYMITHVHHKHIEPWILAKFLYGLDRLYDWSIHEWIYLFTGANLVLIEKETITDEYVKIWHDRGVQVVVWTVNEYREKLRYLNKLKLPFVTDKLSDMSREEIEKL